MKVLLLLILFCSTWAIAQNTWTCTRNDNMVTCQGFQNGRWVTCTTVCYGNQCNTNCY